MIASDAAFRFAYPHLRPASQLMSGLHTLNPEIYDLDDDVSAEAFTGELEELSDDDSDTGSGR